MPSVDLIMMLGSVATNRRLMQELDLVVRSRTVAHPCVYLSLCTPEQVSVMKNTINGASSTRSQVLYQAGLCLWQLSFDEDGLENMKTAGVAGVLVDLLKGGTLSPFFGCSWPVLLACSIELVLNTSINKDVRP